MLVGWGWEGQWAEAGCGHFVPWLRRPVPGTSRYILKGAGLPPRRPQPHMGLITAPMQALGEASCPCFRLSVTLTSGHVPLPGLHWFPATRALS